MRRAGRTLVVLVAVAAVALAAVAALSWRRPAFFPAGDLAPLGVEPLTEAQYAAVHVRFVRPYVVRCENAGGGAALLFGAAHTFDPEFREIGSLRRAWAGHRPTVALVEGRPGGLFAAVGDPVERLGEGGLVIALARSAGVPVWTWEPDRATELARQLKRFPQQRVALFYVLRPYVSQRRFRRPADPDAAVERTRRQRSRWPGLEGALDSVADIDAIWRRDFAGLPDWRDTTDEYGWPGYLEEIFAASNALRDEHLGRLVATLVGRGERVFAAAGSSHAVKLEPAVRAACGEPYAGTLLVGGERRPPG